MREFMAFRAVEKYTMWRIRFGKYVAYMDSKGAAP